MNILVFVMTILMLLASLTYARLENFRSQSLLKAQFENYIKTVERRVFNEAAKHMYDKVKVRSRVTQKNESQKTNATPRLSWYLIVNASARENDPEMFQKIVDLSKQLLFILYSQQKFFIEAQEERPNVLEELIMAFMDAADQQQLKGKKLKEAANLANWEFSDPLLNEFAYKIFKGLPKLEEAPKQVDDLVVKTVTADEEEQAREDAEEFKSDIGYESFLDYITLKSKKIRLFLASKPLLLAIVGDEVIVNEILELRYNLYRAMINTEKMAPQKARENFKSAVTSRVANLDEALFDFTITKVNPKDYE